MILHPSSEIYDLSNHADVELRTDHKKESSQRRLKRTGTLIPALRLKLAKEVRLIVFPF